MSPCPWPGFLALAFSSFSAGSWPLSTCLARLAPGQRMGGVGGGKLEGTGVLAALITLALGIVVKRLALRTFGGFLGFH